MRRYARMFEKLLNKKLNDFVQRANDKDNRWERNKVCTSIYYVYYVEYYEDRLYWVYDYISTTTTMIYASSPSEAVRILEYNLKRL